MIVYLSGTGNSRYVAEELSVLTGERLMGSHAVYETDFHLDRKEDVGIVCPVYSWGIPPAVREFVKRFPEKELTELRSGGKVWGVLTCGDEVAMAPEMLISDWRERGIEMQGIWSVIMPNNYVLLPGFNVDSEAVEKRKLEEAPSEIKRISKEISGGMTGIHVTRGRYPGIKSRLIYPLFCRWGIFPKKWRWTKECISCGKCAEACPVENIEIRGNHPRWGNNCISCLACYHICPVHAVAYGSATERKGQYKCPLRVKREKIVGIALVLCGLIIGGTDASADLRIDFVGSTQRVLEETPAKNTGLDKIFVVNDMSEVTRMMLSGGKVAEVSRYSNLGGGYAEPVATVAVDDKVIVEAPAGNMGYIINDGERNYCFWVIDYSTYPFSLTAVHAAHEQECESTHIDVSGNGRAIEYYSIDGRQCELSREILVSYNNLVWSDDEQGFEFTSAEKTLSHLSDEILLTPPLYCASEVRIRGDRFLREWGMEKEIKSGLIQPNGIAVHGEAIQEESGNPEEGSNIIKGDSQGLGGSAPAIINFSAQTTDAVIHDEWEIARDENFEYPLFRFNEKEIDYTFEEEGVLYARFVGSNYDGSCHAYSETFTISIGASDLRIPNAFSPNGDGVNDIWKVGYRSLISFDCSIFDRYGNLIHHFTDPNSGWDGKRNGKAVPSGVYYYVVEAKGSDGKKYKKGGDINIIGYKTSGKSGSQGAGE